MLIFRQWRIIVLMAGFLLTGLFGQAHAADPEPAPAPANRRWASNEIRIAVSRSLFDQSGSIKLGSEVEGALKLSSEAWTAVSPVVFSFSESESLNVSDPKTGGDGVSLITIASTPENLALFPKGSSSPPAITRRFFDRRGNITEADVVLNPYLQFSTDGTQGTFDLQSVLTHEIGHVLGLDHSALSSSTMFERLAPNSVFGTGQAARSLSLDDIAAVRKLYGSLLSDESCCGAIIGRIIKPADVPDQFNVWIEDASTGAVAASVKPDAVGRFVADGLSEGAYRLMVQGGKDSSIALSDIGTVRVKANDTVTAHPVRILSKSLASIDLIGTNGQLSELPILVEPGTAYQIFLGGKGLEAGSVKFGFTSKDISVVEGTTFQVDFGPQITAVALTIKVSPDITPGEYSVYVQNAQGVKKYMAGAISIERQ